ncbi:MAG TPA: hypothetical protein DDY70_06330 [Clostridiales bacterium]|nr:hypothetical protein [Clostridiales bacterium]
MQNTGKKTERIVISVILLLFVAMSVLSVFMMEKVDINYDLSDYLSDKTETKMALEVIDEEFGMTGSIQVMLKNASDDDVERVKGIIEEIPNVLTVSYDEDKTAYRKDGDALLSVVIDGDNYSANAKQVAADIKAAFVDREGMEYGGTVIEKQELQDAITSEMVFILAVSLTLVVIILLITSESWLEPFLLLAASGVAVLINRGTNLMFGEISYITNSIAAILQLALSIDYSIVLLHTYRREKETASDDFSAMLGAVRRCLKPVSASALTTIAGLLALLFMTFTIGFDIGIVLMKGIVISLITALTLLPALVLLCDPLLKKTKKHAFVPHGAAFTSLAKKAGRVILPVALALVIAAGALGGLNSYLFTDSGAGNPEIVGTFGRNNSVVVVYPKSADSYDKEGKLADFVIGYRTEEGNTVFIDYNAYSNTARELYDINKAIRKADLSEEEAKLLFTMYHLYGTPDARTYTLAEFFDAADRVLASGEADDFIDADTVATLDTVRRVREIAGSDLTYEEFREHMLPLVGEENAPDLFSLRQLYGLYRYDTVTDPTVDFKTMLAYIIGVSEDENFADSFDSSMVSQLRLLTYAVRNFEGQMTKLMTKSAFVSYLSNEYNVTVSEEDMNRIFTAYYTAQGESAKTTARLLPMLGFMVETGELTDEAAVRDVMGKAALYQKTTGAYAYYGFLPAVSAIATAFLGQAPEITATDDEVGQVYIHYFYENGLLTDTAIRGEDFVRFVSAVATTNSAIADRVTPALADGLSDMITVMGALENTDSRTYTATYDTLKTLSESLHRETAENISVDKIAGVYIKDTVDRGLTLDTPMMAFELLDFVSANMTENELLSSRMNDEHREKVADSQKDLDKAKDLFLGETHDRMLFTVNLPNEGQETTDFVEALYAKATEIFGDEAHIAGEIVSTRDLATTFDHDNSFITVFTLVSIFVIIAVIFRSLSLPVILVAVIQGAIFIAMATQIFGNGIFFMSYIVTTCILMGATIDYGILMSSNYVAYRQTMERDEALFRSVEAAMPTVFSSGLILIVCGFVIHFISSQNSISTVGLLLGIGTIASVVMITVVLPAALYYLDAFVLKLSLKGRHKEETK